MEIVNTKEISATSLFTCYDHSAEFLDPQASWPLKQRKKFYCNRPVSILIESGTAAKPDLLSEFIGGAFEV